MRRLFATGARVLRPARARLITAMALIPALVLVACSGQPRQQVQSQDKTPDALYADMDRALASYRDGLHALREGDHDTGRQLLGSATSELAAAGDACVVTPGCEPQRFMAAYSNLLALRSAVLTNEAEGFVRLEPQLQRETSSFAEDVPEAVSCWALRLSA